MYFEYWDTLYKVTIKKTKEKKKKEGVWFSSSSSSSFLYFYFGILDFGMSPRLDLCWLVNLKGLNRPYAFDPTQRKTTICLTCRTQLNLGIVAPASVKKYRHFK